MQIVLYRSLHSGLLSSINLIFQARSHFLIPPAGMTLFPCNRRLGTFVRLKIDKHFNAIFAGESFNQTLFVIPYSLHQIRCYADIQCAVSSACHDVDKELFCHAQPPFLDSRPPTKHFEGMLRGNDVLQSLSSPVNCAGTRLPEDPGPLFLDSRPPTKHFEGMLRGNDALQSPLCMSFGQQPGNFHPPGRAWRYLIAEFSAQLPNLPLRGEAPDS